MKDCVNYVSGRANICRYKRIWPGLKFLNSTLTFVCNILEKVQDAHLRKMRQIQIISLLATKLPDNDGSFRPKNSTKIIHGN